MADVKDILGVSRGGVQKNEGKKEKEKVQRPAGMSREAFALLDGSHPIVPSLAGDLRKKTDLQGLKEKRKDYKGTVTWRWQSFDNTGRKDGLKLEHWVKCLQDANGKVRAADQGPYKFSKYNKKLLVHRYNEEEWENVIAKDPAWSREETDYLLDLCEHLQLRFYVIADRYEFPGGKSQWGVEDLKARYYSIARQLMIAREGNQEDIENRILIKAPFDANHEKERKRAYLTMLKRTPEEEAEENAILDQARAIETARRAQETAQRALQPNGNVSPNSGAAAEAALIPDFTGAVPQGQGSLLSAELQPLRPPPGVYCRRAHTNLQAQAQLAAIPGGARGQKLAETTLQDLGVPDAAKIGTRAVCATWLSLRSEVIAMLDLRGKVRALGGGHTPANSSDTRKKPPKAKGQLR